MSGASRGMGAVLARRAAGHGACLVLMAAAPGCDAPQVCSGELRADDDDARFRAGDPTLPVISGAAVFEDAGGSGCRDYLGNKAGTYPKRPLFEESIDIYDRTLEAHRNSVGAKTAVRLESAARSSKRIRSRCPGSGER